MEHSITSVGIDLGTSTTKMILSRLRLAKKSGAFALPRYEIVERELLYASPVYSTPLLNEQWIDVEKVFAILDQEYKQAGVSLSDIHSGAVIITGETALKKNAEQIVHRLAERSGDFVVAAAGADLEAVLAGKGSGAEARSKHVRGVVASIDIGGGTANTVFFHRGKTIGTLTFHVGGNLIRISSEGVVSYVSEAIRPWLTEKGYRIEPGMQMHYDEIYRLTSDLNRSMLSYLVNPDSDPSSTLLVMGNQLDRMPPIEQLMVSGGIGNMIDQPIPCDLQSTAVFGDIGPLLAATLRIESARLGFQLAVPEQTVRATVIGAGMQSTEISGATFHIDKSLLPIRNVPVMKLELNETILSDEILLGMKLENAFRLAASLYAETSPLPFAIAVKGISYCSYARLQSLAAKLLTCFQNCCPSSEILAVICENDMAKALGQSLAIRSGGQFRFLCIDQIQVEHGDYIDVGVPVSDTIVPVVIKTLAFHESFKG